MTEQNVEVEVKSAAEEAEGPVYYKPGTVSLVSGITSVLSWFVLAAFVGDVVVQFLNINATVTAQGMSFASLFKEPSALSFLVSNLVTPFFTGLAWFFVLQGVALGLNILLELDFNSSEE
jgi:hypothetical protein